MDHLQERLNQLAEQKQLTVPQTYENQILTSIKGHYDDIEDLINLQRALNNIQRLLTDQIEDGFLAWYRETLREIPKAPKKPTKTPDLTYYEAWKQRPTEISKPDHFTRILMEAYDQGTSAQKDLLASTQPEIFTEKKYFSLGDY